MTLDKRDLVAVRFLAGFCTLAATLVGMSQIAVAESLEDYAGSPTPTISPELKSPSPGSNVPITTNDEGVDGWVLSFEPAPDENTYLVGSWTCFEEDCVTVDDFLERENSYFDCFATAMRTAKLTTYEEYISFFDSSEAKDCREERPGSGLFIEEDGTVFLPATRYSPGNHRFWVTYWNTGPFVDWVEFETTLVSSDGEKRLSRYGFTTIQAGPPLDFTIGFLDKDGNLPGAGTQPWIWIFVTFLGLVVIALSVWFAVRRRGRHATAKSS